MGWTGLPPKCGTRIDIRKDCALSKICKDDLEWLAAGRWGPEILFRYARQGFQQDIVPLDIEVHNIRSSHLLQGIDFY